MTISALDVAGTFSGSYQTAVAVTNKQVLVSPLQGAQQPAGTKGQQPRLASLCSGSLQVWQHQQGCR